MTTLRLTKEQGFEILENGDPESPLLLDELLDTGRWHSHHRIVFRRDGKLWEAHYSKGLTETQDEGPWEYENEVIAHEVEEVPVTVVVYKRKQEPNPT